MNPLNRTLEPLELSEPLNLRLYKLLLTRIVLVQELEREVEDLVRELIGLKIPELIAEGAQRHHGLGHRAMAACAADVVEVLPDELAGVA